MAKPVLTMELLDARGRRVSEPVDIMMFHQPTGAPKVVRVPASKRVRITGLTAVPQGLYRMQVDPASYLATGRFVSVPAAGTSVTMRFPVDPRKVKKVKFPAHAGLPSEAQRILDISDAVLGFGEKTGVDLYDALDPVRRAGFLNIVAKCEATAVAGGRSVLSFVGTLHELRGDRFYASVPRELREEVKNSAQAGLFDSAPDLLHHFDDGFERAGSWKTPDHYGNLQLSFFSRGDEWVADIDIDDAGGLAHVFQVLRNQLTDRPTHPYDIHQILLLHQELEPGYDLVV